MQVIFIHAIWILYPQLLRAFTKIVLKFGYVSEKLLA